MSKKDVFYIVVIAGVLLLMMGRCNSDQKRIDARNLIIKEKEAEVETFRTKSGEIGFEKVRVEADLKSLQESYGFLEDSLKELGVKTKQLSSALFLAQRTQGSGEGRIDTVRIQGEADTVKVGLKMEIKERYFDFIANIYESGNYDYNYSTYDSLAIVNVTKRPTPFHARVHSVKIVNANPNAKISGITSLTIVEKPRKFHLGPLVSVTHDGERIRPFIGIGMAYSFLSF